jgi:hypothetical protein
MGAVLFWGGLALDGGSASSVALISGSVLLVAVSFAFQWWELSRTTLAPIWARVKAATLGYALFMIAAGLAVGGVFAWFRMALAPELNRVFHPYAVASITAAAVLAVLAIGVWLGRHGVTRKLHAR